MTEVRHIIARILTHRYGLLILRCGERDAGGKSLTAGQRLFPPEKAGFLSCSVMCSGMIACACGNDNLCLSLSLYLFACAIVSFNMYSAYVHGSIRGIWH